MPDYAGVIFQTLSVLYSRGDFDAYHENKAHPNNVHSCVEKTVEFEKHIQSLTEVLSAEEYVSICNFFVLHAPVIQNAKNIKENIFGQRSLRYYGWAGNAQMNKLERELLKAAGLPSFTIIRSKSIDETLKSMQLYNLGCSTHPRAVLKQNSNLEALENGTIKISDDETRMECLFRHVRNALAHNRTFAFPNSMIMLQDEEENHKISARLLVPLDTLSKWKSIIAKEENEAMIVNPEPK